MTPLEQSDLDGEPGRDTPRRGAPSTLAARVRTALCVSKLCISAASLLGVARSEQPLEHLKDIFEALESGGEAAAKLRASEARVFVDALRAAKKDVQAEYEQSLRRQHSDGSTGCRLRTRARPGHPLVQLGRGDPEECSGPQAPRTGTPQPVPREHPRSRLLPLKGEMMLTHPLAELAWKPLHSRASFRS